MPWYCGNCGNQGAYYRSDGPPPWCTECGARKEAWRYQTNPPVPYSRNIPGADIAGLPGGHPYTEADKAWQRKLEQDAKDRARIWREGRWDD